MAFLPGLTSRAGSGLKEIGSLLAGESPSVSDRQNLTPQQLKQLEDLISGMQTGGQFDVTGTYGGPLTAGQNQLQGASLAALEQSAMNQVGPTSAGAVSQKALTDIAGQTPEDLQTYFQRAIFDPTMQQVNQQLIPELTRRFGGQAGFGSDRLQQEQQLAQGVSTGIAGQVAEAVRNQQQLKLQAAQALPQAAGADIQNLLSLQQGGNIAQAVEQQPISAAYAEFQRQQAAKNTQINAILQALGIQTTTPVVNPGSAGLLGGGLGEGLGKAAGTAAITAMLSDRRLKTNIKRIGTHILGIGIYSFDYIWGIHAIGVMADEVETVMPDAVITLPSSFKIVDYSMLESSISNPADA